ncbi:DedA family protein [Corynebacterium doosanense]|uniref:DedA family protein n=1 Tax=Corynebacterium doosanense TaxID=1121358 RepID=UPI001FDED981|nr:DedA family protein [Corynebacterium doosanense]
MVRLPDPGGPGGDARDRIGRHIHTCLSTGLFNVQDQLTLWVESVVNYPAFLPIVTLFTLVDSLVPLIPSETILSIGAAWSGSTGSPDIWHLIWFAVAGAMIGDNICFYAGHRFKDRVDRIRPNSRPGRALSWIRRAMRLYGGAAIIIARFIPWARWVLTLMLGSVRYNWFLFFFFDTLGVLVWAGMISGASYLGGMLFQGSPLIGMVAGILAGMLVGLLVQKAQGRFMEWRDERQALSRA